MSTVFGSIQSTTAPPPTELKYPAVVMRSHQIVVSYEFARSNDDDDDDSSRVEDQQEQGGGVRGRGCMKPSRRGRGHRLGRGRGRGGHGTFSQCVEWDGRDTSGITQDQHIVNGP